MQFFLLIAIAVSLGALVFALFSKSAEIKSGKQSLLSKCLGGADPAVEKIVSDIKKNIFSWNANRFMEIIRNGSFKIFHFFGTAGLFVSKCYVKISNRVKGKKSLKLGGAVSFFLKNMSESEGKDEGEKKM